MVEFHLTGQALWDRMNRAVQVDEAAVRTTRDVDILLRRADLPRVITAMEQAGFVYRHSAGLDMFLDGVDAKERDAVHALMAEEKVRDSDLVAAPDVNESVMIEAHRTLTLEALVRMKINVFRDKDRMHLRDMLEVGLIDESWAPRFPSELACRLQQLISDPLG